MFVDMQSYACGVTLREKRKILYGAFVWHRLSCGAVLSL